MTLLPNANFFFGARNDFSGAVLYNSYQHAFSFLGDGLTDTEASNLYYSVQKFQTTLGRQVGTPIYSSNATDVNARLFLGATNIQDVTITSAVDTLVQGLKTDGVWTKLKAVYPFVGGTATTHKFNLANALDEDTSFRLSFSGGWTHSSNGATPNGTNAFANTFLNPAAVIANSIDGHLTYYSRSNTTSINAIEIGSGNPATAFDMVIKFGATNLAGACLNMQDSNVFTNLTSSLGFYHANQNNTANIRKMFKNGVVLQTQTSLTNSTPADTIYIGAKNATFSGGATFFSNRQCAFATIGNGLTDTEASNLYLAVQAFQTTLNRQV
jgi:hypothetical protein